MEFINKADLTKIIETKLKEFNDERAIVKQQQISIEEKRPLQSNINIQEAIWMRLRDDISNIPVFHTEPLIILRGGN